MAKAGDIMIFYDKLFTRGVKDIDEVIDLINSHYEIDGLKLLIYFKESHNLFEVVPMKYIYEVLCDKKFVILGFCYRKSDEKHICKDMIQHFVDEEINLFTLKEHMRLYL